MLFAVGLHPPGHTICAGSENRLISEDLAICNHHVLLLLPNWIFPHFADKRLNKEPMESEISGFSELIKSNSYFQMVVFRLSFVSTEKSVPPGEIKSIIAVGFVWFYRVMNPVHIRSNYQES